MAEYPAIYSPDWNCTSDDDQQKQSDDRKYVDLQDLKSLKWTAYEVNSNLHHIPKSNETRQRAQDLKGGDGRTVQFSSKQYLDSTYVPELKSVFEYSRTPSCSCQCTCSAPPTAFSQASRPVESCLQGLHQKYRDFYPDCTESHLPNGYRDFVEHDDLYLPSSRLQSAASTECENSYMLLSRSCSPPTPPLARLKCPRCCGPSVAPYSTPEMGIRTCSAPLRPGPTWDMNIATSSQTSRFHQLSCNILALPARFAGGMAEEHQSVPIPWAFFDECCVDDVKKPSSKPSSLSTEKPVENNYIYTQCSPSSFLCTPIFSTTSKQYSLSRFPFKSSTVYTSAKKISSDPDPCSDCQSHEADCNKTFSPSPQQLSQCQGCILPDDKCPACNLPYIVETPPLVSPESKSTSPVPPTPKTYRLVDDLLSSTCQGCNGQKTGPQMSCPAPKLQEPCLRPSPLPYQPEPHSPCQPQIRPSLKWSEHSCCQTPRPSSPLPSRPFSPSSSKPMVAPEKFNQSSSTLFPPNRLPLSAEMMVGGKEYCPYVVPSPREYTDSEQSCDTLQSPCRPVSPFFWDSAVPSRKEVRLTGVGYLHSESPRSYSDSRRLECTCQAPKKVKQSPGPGLLEFTSQKREKGNQLLLSTLIRSPSRSPVPSSSSHQRSVEDVNLLQFLNNVKQILKPEFPSRVNETQQRADDIFRQRTTERGSSPIAIDPDLTSAGYDVNRPKSCPAFEAMERGTSSETRFESEYVCEELETSIRTQQAQANDRSIDHGPVQALSKTSDLKSLSIRCTSPDSSSWVPRAASRQEVTRRCCCGISKCKGTRCHKSTICPFCENLHACCCGMCSCPFPNCSSKSPIPDSDSTASTTDSRSNNIPRIVPGFTRTKSLSPDPVLRRKYLAGIEPQEIGPLSISSKPSFKLQLKLCHPSPRTQMESFNCYLKSQSRHAKTLTPEWRFPQWRSPLAYSLSISPERRCSQRPRRSHVHQAQRGLAPKGIHPIMLTGKTSNAKFCMSQYPHPRLSYSSIHRGRCWPT